LGNISRIFACRTHDRKSDAQWLNARSIRDPLTLEAAKEIIIHVLRFFDYGNQEFVKKLVNMYFENGYPYEPHLTGVRQDLADLRTMRNASAHITSTTQTALETLALRVLHRPSSGIDLYTLLMEPEPGSASGNTIFVTYRDRLLVAAELIARG
jgi:hypothetical protein